MQSVSCSVCIGPPASEIQVKNSVEQLLGAKKARMSWMEVGSIFRTISQQAGPDRARYEREAAAASEYSIGVLKRFVVALNFVESPWLKQSEMPKRPVLEASFTAIELIERYQGRIP